MNITKVEQSTTKSTLSFSSDLFNELDNIEEKYHAGKDLLKNQSDIVILNPPKTESTQNKD